MAGRGAPPHPAPHPAGGSAPPARVAMAVGSVVSVAPGVVLAGGGALPHPAPHPAGGSAPPQNYRPISTHEFVPRWCPWRERYAPGDDWRERWDLEQGPSGTVIVEETRHFHVITEIPIWPCDQIECTKRAWVEVMKLRLKKWLWTKQFHIEVWDPCSSGWERAQLYEYLGGQRLGGRRLRVVFDEIPVLSPCPPGGRPWPWPPSVTAVTESLPVEGVTMLTLEM